MLATLRDELADVRLASGLRKKLSIFSQAQNFAFFVMHYTSKQGKQFCIDNYPETYRELPDADGRDPLLKRIRKDNPEQVIFWGKEDYLNADAGDIWENASSYGISSGVAIPIHSAQGRLLVGFSVDQVMPKQDPCSAELIGQYASMLAGVAVDLFETNINYEARLTEREIEALRWTFDGFSEAEVGDKMRLGTLGVIRDLDSATMKLGARSKHQAAMMAARYGVLGVG